MDMEFSFASVSVKRQATESTKQQVQATFPANVAAYKDPDEELRDEMRLTMHAVREAIDSLNQRLDGT